MITAFTPTTPMIAIAYWVSLVWLLLLSIIPAGKWRDLVKGFGIGVIMNLVVLSCAGAADNPVGYLNDGEFRPSKVYEYTDPKTLRRWLIFQVLNGNGGHSIAAVEATLTDGDRARLNPPRPPPVPAAPPKPVPKNTVDPWEMTTTLAPLTAEQMKLGWVCYQTTTLNGRPLYLVRRANPDYVPPADLPVEAK